MLRILGPGGVEAGTLITNILHETIVIYYTSCIIIVPVIDCQNCRVQEHGLSQGKTGVGLDGLDYL